MSDRLYKSAVEAHQMYRLKMRAVRLAVLIAMIFAALALLAELVRWIGSP